MDFLEDILDLGSILLHQLLFSLQVLVPRGNRVECFGQIALVGNDVQPLVLRGFFDPPVQSDFLEAVLRAPADFGHIARTDNDFAKGLQVHCHVRLAGQGDRRLYQDLLFILEARVDVARATFEKPPLFVEVELSDGRDADVHVRLFV
jgi:hypothetical protein